MVLKTNFEIQYFCNAFQHRVGTLVLVILKVLIISSNCAVPWCF